MQLKPTELRTQRLLLRPWRLTDIDDAFSYAADAEWARYLWRVPQPYTRQDAEEFVTSSAQDGWTDQASFAIEREGHAIGGVRLGIADPGARVASLAYNLGREHWGEGIATEAAETVLGYGFSNLHLTRVFATADARNLASISVMQKLGMKREGILRKHRYFRGEYVDEVYYAILADEYESRGSS